MRQLIYHVATTLDGFIARPGGSVDGFLESGDHVKDYLQSLQDYDTVIMGRKTYEFGYQYGLQPGQPAYAHMMHYIISRTLSFDQKHDQVEVVREDEVGLVRQLKQQVGSPIYLCGGGQLAGLMLQHQLIDRLILKLNPLFFGTGIGLFGDVYVRHTLEQEGHLSYSSGVHVLQYKVHYDS